MAKSLWSSSTQRSSDWSSLQLPFPGQGRTRDGLGRSDEQNLRISPEPLRMETNQHYFRAIQAQSALSNAQFYLHRISFILARRGKLPTPVNREAEMNAHQPPSTPSSSGPIFYAYPLVYAQSVLMIQRSTSLRVIRRWSKYCTVIKVQYGNLWQTLRSRGMTTLNTICN
jgi:hypothetical protein